MHYDVYSQILYVSLPNEKIVIKIEPNAKNDPVSPMTDSSSNKTYQIVAGVVGKTCIGNKICGDGGLAVDAMLTYPKVKNLSSGTTFHSLANSIDYPYSERLMALFYL